jgi:cyclophilin family peptidyl-prolyl cis-trans isomerase
MRVDWLVGFSIDWERNSKAGHPRGWQAAAVVGPLAISLILAALVGCGREETGRAGKANAQPSQAARRMVASRVTASRSEKPREATAPEVALETTQGRIVLRLDSLRAPRTVENFLRYVDAGHYNGTIFHQVADGCMILGGGFTPSLTEKPVAGTVVNEASNGLRNRRGTIAMARPLEAVDGATCQFFINLRDNPQFDHRDNSPAGYGYCVFGEVISGMEALDEIAKIEVETTGEFELLPTRTVMIESARRLR